MSELPAIDSAKLAKKLMGEITELTYQKYQLEVLAETLRDERDQARAEKDAIVQQLQATQTPFPVDIRPVDPNEFELDENGELKFVEESAIPEPTEVFDITSVDKA